MWLILTFFDSVVDLSIGLANGANSSPKGAAGNSPGRKPWVGLSNELEPCKGGTGFKSPEFAGAIVQSCEFVNRAGSC